MRNELIVENVKKIYFEKIKIQNSTEREITLFSILQDLLSKFFYLIHVNIKRTLFIDFNVNKKFDFDVIIYHVKKEWLQKTFENEKHDYFSRIVVEFILFLNRLLNFVKIRYWFIEFEITEIIWIFKKVRHLIKAFISTMIIYIDYDVVLRIAKQTSFIITFMNKLNLRLIRTFDYFQRFNLDIRHKSKQQHIIFDVFSRLTFVNIVAKFFINMKLFANENELNALFIVSLMKINEVFRKRIIDDYKNDLNWQKIEIILNIENDVKLSFSRKNDLIFKIDDFIIDFHVYESRRLCISHSIVANILKMIHDENHDDFARYYKKISIFYYIRSLIKYFQKYFKHCLKC